MSNDVNPDDYAIIMAESPLAKYVYNPYIKKYLTACKDCSVLDLRCSEGHFTRMAKICGVGQVIGIDGSLNMLERARRLETEKPVGIDYLQGDATAIRLEKKFSLVQALWLACTLSSKQKVTALAETIYFHTMPAGRALLLVSDLSRQVTSDERDDRYGKGLDFLSQPQEGSPFRITLEAENHSVQFTDYAWFPKTIIKSLKSAGFANTTIEYLGVSNEGIAALGKEYWQTYNESPFIAVIEASI